MQQSWRDDTDKLTFIICRAPSAPVSTVVPAKAFDAPKHMLGDINLFLSEEADSDSDSEDSFVPDRGYFGKRKLVGEVEVMIADCDEQRKGYGRAAVLMFLWYVVVRRDEIVASHCDDGVLCHLRAKIHKDNVGSIALFESLLFKKRSEEPNWFGEYELVLHDLDVVRIIGMMRRYGLKSAKGLRYAYE